MATETFAVALIGQTDSGWLVEADSADAALDHVHRTVDRARKYQRDRLMLWTEQRYRELYLLGDEWPAGWTRLSSTR